MEEELPLCSIVLKSGCFVIHSVHTVCLSVTLEYYNDVQALHHTLMGQRFPSGSLDLLAALIKTWTAAKPPEFHVHLLFCLLSDFIMNIVPNLSTCLHFFSTFSDLLDESWKHSRRSCIRCSPPGMVHYVGRISLFALTLTMVQWATESLTNGFCKPFKSGGIQAAVSCICSHICTAFKDL